MVAATQAARLQVVFAGRERAYLEGLAVHVEGHAVLAEVVDASGLGEAEEGQKDGQFGQGWPNKHIFMRINNIQF